MTKEKFGYRDLVSNQGIALSKNPIRLCMEPYYRNKNKAYIALESHWRVYC